MVCALAMWVAIGSVAVAPGGGAGSGAATRPLEWPAHPDWQQFVLAPATDDVRPASIVSTSGDVTEANTVANPSLAHPITLTMNPGEPQPSIVVDYGRDVGGVPYFDVQSQTGTPILSSSYSEGRQYIGPAGDNAPSNSSAGNTSRVDRLTVGGPGTVTEGLIQGGERYQEIELTSMGSVTLRAIGIRFTAMRATPKNYRGWFDSSSTALNRIWYDGAYTTQLDELPAQTLPSAWSVVHGGLINDGGLGGIVSQGAGWTNASVSFDANVVSGEAGWMVRATSSQSGYFFFLGDEADTTGPPNSLREFSLSSAGLRMIADVPLHSPVLAGSWHHISTVVDGTDITTSLDGHRVASFTTTSLPPGIPTYDSGSCGFFESPGQSAQFRDLDVVGPHNTTLFSNRLARATALSDFTGPSVRSGDLLPVIMDGAKRDRVVWSGDLGVEGPNVFYTTAADDFVKDSLKLLDSYQSANGEAGAQAPPDSPLGTFPESGSTYSASYSMDDVANLATYYLYTGDLTFVRTEWPMVTRELAYNRSMVDSRGLLATNNDNGMDWDYYDGPKSGEVTAYNDIYYGALTNAATMASDLGLHAQAASYRSEATTLRSAINHYLLNPQTMLYATSNLLPNTVAQDANALAVTDGVVDRGQGTSLLKGLQLALPPTPYGPLPFTATTGYMAAVSPFVTNEQVRAEFAQGDTASALSLLQELWGYMDSPGPDFTGADWELIAPTGAPGFGSYTSLAHGWASGATADLSQYVLGVQPSRPGYRAWLVQPHPGSLTWAEGNVPTPSGTITVRWAQSPTSGAFSLRVSAPKGTAGNISVPVPTVGATVTITVVGNANVLRSIQTASGATYQSINVTGGRAYHLNVVPVTSAH
jgi:alpha-L-rhamnosidase